MDIAWIFYPLGRNSSRPPCLRDFRVLWYSRLNLDFGRDTVQKSLEHLADLKPLFQKPSVEDRYASWLKDDFFCGVIFFELTQTDARDAAAVRAILGPEPPKGPCQDNRMAREGGKSRLTGTVRKNGLLDRRGSA
jgi:hypothetical protein